MVSPEHIDAPKPEDQQAPSSAVEQQVWAGVETKRLWLKPLMRGAAIVLSLGGSFAIAWALATTPSVANDYGGLVLLGVLILEAVCALLCRSWWAILYVPLAFAAGELLMWYLIPLVISPNPLAHLATDDGPFGVALYAIFGSLAAIFGAWIGAAISVSISKARK
jgi:hypothetical protein